MPLPESIFVAAISLITYTYLLYPAGIWLLSQLRPSELPPPLQDADCPEVTAVMAVFNESRRLPRTGLPRRQIEDHRRVRRFDG
jgi:hypothetical protein